jgi:hypothetical protein
MIVGKENDEREMREGEGVGRRKEATKGIARRSFSLKE